MCSKEEEIQRTTLKKKKKRKCKIKILIQKKKRREFRNIICKILSKDVFTKANLEGDGFSSQWNPPAMIPFDREDRRYP